MRVAKRRLRDVLLTLAGIAIIVPALTAQEQQPPRATIEQAVAAARQLRSVGQEAETLDHALGGFFIKKLEEAGSRGDAGDVLLANGACGAAAAAYQQAGQTCRDVLDIEQRAPELIPALERFLRLLTILEMEPRDESSIKVIEAAKEGFQSAQEKTAADDVAGAVQTIQDAVKAVESAVIPVSATTGETTLASAVALRAEILSSKTRIASEDELEDMIGVAGELEPDDQPLVQLLQHARTMEQQAREYMDTDEFGKAVLMFAKTKAAYERVKTLRDEVLSTLKARAAMLRERKAAEEACPGEFRPLAFEQAVRQQRQADDQFRKAEYEEAATSFQQVTETYLKAAEEARIWKALFAAEKRWYDRLAGVDRALLEQQAASEFRSLQDEAEEITPLRRANKPAAALKRIEAVMMRLAAIEKMAQFKERDVRFASALQKAQLAVEGGDLRTAQAALTRAARHRPGDPQLAAFAKKAGLFILAWSFNDGMERWKAKGSPTVWYHVLDETAIGGGCLRAGEPGEATYSTNARTTITSPVKINLRFFEEPTLRFRHCIKGETASDRIAVSVGGVAVWNGQSTAEWADVEVDLTAAKKKLQKSGEIVFTFHSDSSGTGPGGYLDEIQLFDAILSD